MDCTGKVALVTGAAVRVGRAIALELARAGCDLAIHYRSSGHQAEKLAAEIHAIGRRVKTIPADLADAASCEAVVDHAVASLGRLDILVNNAAIFPKSPLEQASASAWQKVLNVNLVAPALLARRAAPVMRRAGEGRIVNLIDILADRPVKNFGPYCASKAALATLTRTLALELAPQITVNGIAPGIAMFPENYDAELRQRLIDRVPLKREGTPEEIARLVRFLVAEGDYITGQIIALDGGSSVGE